ncbi:BamA/TamA family outer membrane protein [Pedobacter sp. JY14-1]|uniref:translocation and assembly module lipoprotein TamL n=1 Tax=Pedobacter sp. JY14-1 TaxID=3034151 RepID=UPI0023E1B75E|nr:BamA/TamA family outer membrane protein [Pedobacter sp. JY14-1]
MKAYLNPENNVLFAAILLFILVFGAGCSSTKYIADYQSIVKKVRIDSIDNAFEEEAYNYIQKDIRPASVIGINVVIYNIFNTKDGKYKTSNIKPLGTPPPILDSTLVEISRNQIEKFLKSKGYFNAVVKSEITIKKKRAKVVYTARQGQPFTVNKLNFEIADPSVKELYVSRKQEFTHLREGARFDDDSLSYERDQLQQLMRENGYFDFSKPYVKYTVDSNLNANKANVTLVVDNPDGKPAHERYHIGETKVIIAPDADGFRDTIVLNTRAFKDVRYTDLSGKFRRNPIVRYNFLSAPEQYDVRNEELTYDRMYELNVFKNVKIEYSKAGDSSKLVLPSIYLIPQKIMSNRVEGEVPFNGGTVGFNLSNTYSNNNLFRGAERFEFQVKGGLQSRIGQGSGLFSDIYQRDFSLSANLSVPRLMLPLITARPGRRGGMPHTIFSTSYVYALQKEAFRRRVFLNSVTYEFVESKSRYHSVTPFNLEYRFGNLLLDTSTVFGRQQFEANRYTINLLDRRNITLGIKYAYSLNANRLLENSSFVYMRANMDMAGNMLQLASKIGGAASNPKQEDYATLFGLPFNQYLRPEVDLRWYKYLGGERQLVTRLNAGIGYAYGNSIVLPFEKLFFAGGASGVRAWQARTLGPGNYNRGQRIADENSRKAFYGLDQLGDMRIEANLEYRYKLLNRFFGAKLKGAVFLDAGNIWNASSNSSAYSETYFDVKKLGKQIALGTGMGFRYDVQYFVFRFDMGLKLKDPQFSGSDQWVISKFLSGGKAFRDAYDKANSPDRYRFLQYNFGIGMPF